MGLHTRLAVTVLVQWLVLSELVTSCPQSCDGTDSATLDCPYNVKLKENNSSSEMLISCCEFRNTLYSNRTYNKVTVLYPKNCNSSFLNMNFSLLIVNDIVLKDNNLTSVEVNINNQYVKTIDMSVNKIVVVKKGIFNKFKNIQELNLRKNRIKSISEESFTGLTELQTLDLSENKLTVLNNFLNPLISLQQVNLSKNNIENIDEKVFSNILLHTLDFSHNDLKDVVPGALQLLPNLVRLLLTDNPNLGIAQRDIQLLVGSGRRLQLIDASRTGLHRVPEAFTHSVRFLSLDGNTITSIRCGDFDSYPLLQSIELTDNEMGLVEDDSLGRLEMLLLLNLNNNKLNTVPKTLTANLKYLSINNNLINNLTKADFKNLSNLDVLLLQNNKIVSIEEETFRDLSALKVLDLSYNPIKTLSTSTFDGPLSLRDLRLCYINVSVPEKDGSFPMSSPETIQMLHMQSSPSLARQLLADSAALAALSHLQYLDLRMNNISEIRNDLIFYLGQLKTLRLHGNQFNCNNELWMKDWLNWNGTVANGETCYFATSAPEEDVESKYDYSFSSKVFTSDAFPPVNLYSSDEMVNKLIKYYGYENKIDEGNIINSTKHFNDTNTLNVARKRKLSSNYMENNLIPGYFRKNINFPSLKINDIKSKAKRIAKILDQNQYPTENNNSTMKHESLGSNVNGSYNNAIKYENKQSSGRRLNTPVIINVTRTTQNIKQPTNQINGPENGSNSLNTKIDEEENIRASKYMPYQSEKGFFFRFIGTTFIPFLVTISIVLVVILRIKQRKRSFVEEEEQIEIANISGGVPGAVLW